MVKKNLISDNCDCFLCKHAIKEWHAAISAHKKSFKVKKGEKIFKEGDPVTGVYFVYSGTVKVYKKWDAEKELIIRFARDGAILGHRGIGGDAIYPVSASALEAGVVCYIDMDFFEASLKVNPEFAYRLLMFFADELRESEKKMRNLAHMPVKGRVAEALILLNKQFGTSSEGYISIDLSRQDLASYAGATYETVFRVINELVAEQLITLSGKSIAIANYDGLLSLTQEAATQVPV
ncbi:Crp/Fnr family transcriptional regulator [Mucilaginibacter sp. UR6-1]|uniref:Crp/Fnr family transcriptional regulator n=1 Tax=Mucilaginibacter sp. UR6-1 TaxID=1435643 RepID=UPI001E60FDB5|nr:Crp/Fnr family transcriptional regulator [Mucilaginibacter sp. UR6-1]MCC8407591.1 Crp/Fnr family transcriptional regulator [Mucilaginibacter sp. UR6-1]